MLNVHKNHKAYYSIRDGEMGLGWGGVGGGYGGREGRGNFMRYILLHCHHQMTPALLIIMIIMDISVAHDPSQNLGHNAPKGIVKMGSDESHFNV